MSEQNSKVNPTETAPLDQLEQISFTQLVQILLRQKNIVLGMVALGILLAAIYTSFLKPQYQAKGYLKVGHYHSGETTIIPIVAPLDVLAKIQAREQLGRPQGWIESATASGQFQSMIEIKSKGSSEAAAIKVIQELSDKFAQEQAPIFKDAQAFQKIQLKAMREKLIMLEQAQTVDLSQPLAPVRSKSKLLGLFSTSKPFSVPPSSHNGSMPKAFLQELVTLSTHMQRITAYTDALSASDIRRLKSQIERYSKLVQPSQAQRTQLIALKSSPTPFFPSWPVMLCSGFLWGLALGLLAAFGFEIFTTINRFKPELS